MQPTYLPVTLHKVWCILALVFLTGSVFAQSSVIVKVISEREGSPIDFASVQLTGTQQNYYGLTDSTGIFRFKDVAPGSYQVEVHHLSFANMVPEVLQVEANEQVIKKYTLSTSSTELGTIEITSNLGNENVRSKFSTVSANHITAAQIENSPGSFKDPARAAMSGAGVAATGSEEKNELIIRGNSSRGMAWYVEGIPVPSPNHFSDEGASNGAVNMISSNNISGADLYTGAFPAEFGNATAGVFSLDMRHGNLAKHKYGFEIGLIGLSARAEGPIKKQRSSYIFNYRYSTFALVEKMGIDIKGLQTPKYQDVNFKFYFKLNDKTTFEIFGVNGGSNFGKEQFADVNGVRTKVKTYDEGYALYMNGFTLRHQINDRLSVNTTMAYVGNIIKRDAERLSDSLSIFENDGHQRIRYHSAKSHTYLSYQKGTKTLQTGIYATHTSFGIDLSDEYRNQKPTERLRNNDNTYELAHYIAGKTMLGSRFLLTGGIYSMYHYLTRKFVAEPRIGAKFIINEHSEISYSAGLHSRFESPITYLGEVQRQGIPSQPNRFLKPMRALHNVFGYTLRVKQHTYFHVEVYHQYLFDIPVKANNKSGFSSISRNKSFIKGAMNNDGIAWNYGIEFSLQQYLPKQFFVNTNLSVFDSKYVGSNGKVYNTPYNNNVVSNLMFGKKFEIGRLKRNSIVTGFRVAMGGGIRYSEIDIAASIAEGEAVETEDGWFSKKGPMFYRIDFGFMYKIDREKIDINIKLDIQNLTDQQRISGYEYDRKYGLIQDEQGQLLPSLFLEFLF